MVSGKMINFSYYETIQAFGTYETCGAHLNLITAN